MNKHISVMKPRAAWVQWLETFGPGRFYDSFVKTAQDAEGHCVYCRQEVYLDIVEGGGVPDWRTQEGDYGCNSGTKATKDSCGTHVVRKLVREEP